MAGRPNFKEAELVALSLAVKNFLRIRKLQVMLPMVVDESTVREVLEVSISKDSQAFILNARNQVLSEMYKHFNLKYQYIIDNISKGHVKLHYVPSGSMVVDVFSIDLARTKFAQLIALLGN